MNRSPSHDHPHRVTKPFFTFGTLTLLIFMGVGFSFGITRLLLGLGTVTNLDDHNPWGIWISFDVACGVALAAGGFTTAALVDIFGRRKYHALLRPAILTAFLGYLWVAIALSFDLGRYWNIWRPLVHWQGNSVLFEVGMCVTFYLVVLSVEMAPPVLQGLMDRLDEEGRIASLLRRVEGPIRRAADVARLVLPIFIVAGVVLSFMHQSSLGTLMLIAPTKMSALWHTPILPILFLLSAIAVGFPMVILESIYANISFGRNPEMELLTPLAGKIPWFLGTYGVVKLGDLAVRHQRLGLFDDPAATTSLLVEVLVGIVAPFLLLLSKAVRRSKGWLFFAVSLVIFGVVLNRINVFLVAYNPPYSTRAYFPSIGEIAMTVAIVSSILFCYRFFVTFFPVLPGYVAPTDEQHAADGFARSLSPSWTWAIRASAVAVLLGFVAFYSLVHVQAIRSSQRTVNEVRRVHAELPMPPMAARGPSYPQRPAGYKNYYRLEDAALNAASDDYEPVGFSHRIHDGLTGGDCAACHHRYASDPSDRVGVDLGELHKAMGVAIGGACSACHDDLADRPPQGCKRCHARSNEPDAPARLGLKGAYHRQCIGCHERQLKPATAPTGCRGCHQAWVPDHSLLVSFAGAPAPREVTRACLSCHARVGHDLVKTAHWKWTGNSPALAGREHRTDVSLTLVVNNYCLAIGSNLQQCSACHIGYGGVDGTFDFSNPENIDCLVCHDATGRYRKDPLHGGLPDPQLDLAAIARQVGRPSRRACGSCHFHSGGSPNAKHGDLEPALADAGAGLDVHMGLLDMRCQKCHTTSLHRIAGRSMSAPAVEGEVTCEQCHGARPHAVTGVLGRHLDDHMRAVACETCHIPFFAQATPTLLHRDYSSAGQDRQPALDEQGMPDYDKKFGALKWGRRVVPTYLWHDGTRNASLLGDTIDASSPPVVLNGPVADKRNPAARIFPFKAHTAVQPYDTQNNVLAVPSLLDNYWADFDWPRAIAAGMKRVGLPYSGQYGFVETKMYSALHHGVVPARQALGCADCHAPAAVACTRCHDKATAMDLPRHRLPVYPDAGPRLDFGALGYPGDPALVGGRFYIGLGRGVPR